ncbi:MAG: tRNA pseudouridine(38-40) synthase TruA [Lachnospiraceae bacterium]|nr:tRNA pseudouridine(38-40) synthase TruA [Lachnospiraceae bacterium]
MSCNYKLAISYDGTRYYGWEHQPNTDMTIQGKIETVFTRMLQGEKDDETVETVKIIAAGRTDAGVHARAMIANVVLDTVKSPEEIMEYANTYLPEDISINSVSIASDRFHARYKALGKTYRYTLWTGKAKPVFDRKYVTVIEKPLDIKAMEEAAKHLIGTHDFKSFCGNSKMKKSTVRCLDTINIEESGSYVRIYYHGNSFLQNMVRILTGTLLQVGEGERSPDEIKEVLESKDRNMAGPTAPPGGLTLMKVDY